MLSNVTNLPFGGKKQQKTNTKKKQIIDNFFCDLNDALEDTKVHINSTMQILILMIEIVKVNAKKDEKCRENLFKEYSAI